MANSNRPDPELFLDDHRGVYIPRDFAECIKRDCLRNVSDEDLEILKQPDHESYWDTWADVLDNAIVHSDDGKTVRRYRLYQDGALWLIPEGMEWSDAEEWFVWPIEDDKDPAVAYSQGFDRGNYGNAYETTSWSRFARKNRYDEHSKPYQEGMLVGFFSSYELDEIADEELRERVAALRTKHNAHD